MLPAKAIEVCRANKWLKTRPYVRANGRHCADICFNRINCLPATSLANEQQQSMNECILTTPHHVSSGV